MLFQSFEFIAFLLVFITGLLLCPRRLVLPFVTIASLVFYCFWYPPYTFVMLGMIVLGWGGASLVSRQPRLLPYVVTVALLPLLFFKYTKFMLENLALCLNWPAPSFNLALPLGISFVTFTVISLLVDTVKQQKPAPSFFETSSYITFFPHLIAGPILRAGNTIPQFHGLRVDWSMFPAALCLFAAGIIKKVMIADPIGSYVDTAYSNVQQLTSLDALLAVCGFSVQIYCDFSAYSDMAIAIALMFGVKFPENFQSPLTKTSITATWSAWHMTLTHWLRDYVMIPLYAKTRHSSKHIAIVLTMLISGLWHGADWTFIVWGLCHGVIIAIELETGYSRFTGATTGFTRAIFVAINFLLWSLLNVLFRAQDLASALAMWRALFTWPAEWAIPDSPVLYLCLALLALHKFDQVSWILNKAKSADKRILLPICALLIIGGITVAQGRPSTFYYFDF